MILYVCVCVYVFVYLERPYLTFSLPPHTHIHKLIYNKQTTEKAVGDDACIGVPAECGDSTHWDD